VNGLVGATEFPQSRGCMYRRPSGRTAAYLRYAWAHRDTFPRSVTTITVLSSHVHSAFWTLATTSNGPLNNPRYRPSAWLQIHFISANIRTPSTVKDQMDDKAGTQIKSRVPIRMGSHVRRKWGRIGCTVHVPRYCTCNGGRTGATEEEHPEYSYGVRSTVPPYLRTCTTMSPPGRRSCRTGRKAAREQGEPLTG
jgi:hypothetical protein